ncbi:MAG: hypothetical protein ACTSRC_07285 [Candidatus Helarchaeota archaeon]
MIWPGDICADLDVVLFIFLYAKTHLSTPHPTPNQFYAFLERAKRDPTVRQELVAIMK